MPDSGRANAFANYAPHGQVGVGLRHDHYHDCLAQPVSVDFIEVHAENFFAEGGAALALLEEVRAQHPVSIHATSLGLGSAQGIPASQLQKLKRLVDHINPCMVSDHACFAWAQVANQPFHAGDLLPIPFNQHSLQIIVDNIKQVQDTLGRQIFVENLSAYLEMPDTILREVDFLVSMCEKAQCKLLLDLNNLVVNATNQYVAIERPEPSTYADEATVWVAEFPATLVGEIHLAGCTPAAPDQYMVDDHSHPVPDLVWQVFNESLKIIGPKPTLIEWDNQLPDWQVLVGEADKARDLIIKNQQAASHFAQT